MVDWGVFSERLIRLHKGQAQEGRPPYDRAIILKMLLLSHLCNLSERQMEVYVNDNLSARCFLGLTVDEVGPDHSTLTAFKRRIVEGEGEQQLAGLLEEVVHMAVEQGLPIETYFGDRGYDDTENHYQLETMGLHSALKLNKYRTQKKDGNKEVWQAMVQTDEYQAGQRVRYKIERKYGEAKENHGLRRCRYLGRIRYAIQTYLTVIAMDLKRMVKLLTGINFKGRAYIGA